MIPESYIFKIETNKKTELYNKKQIQENIDFKTKIKDILSDITNKIFFKHSSAASSHIWNLKEFRDEIIHTKHHSNPSEYEFFIKRSLNFDYEIVIQSVAKFMNHYKLDYITECECGEDF